MPGPSEERLFAILVNYRVADHLARLLASGCLAGCDVLLVDNGSQPAEVQALAEQYGADVLLLDRNHGFAAAVNRAVARRGDRPGPILLLNPDVHVTADDLAALRAALEAESLTGVAPVLVGGNGSVQVGAAGGPLTLGGFASYFLFLSHLLPRRARGAFFTRRQLLDGMAPDWLCMACLVVAGDAFARFGPVPEDELVYAEDLSWGTAATAAGARFALVPGVRVVHERGASGGSAQWTAAVARLAVRRNGPIRGAMCVAVIRLGLALRRLVRLDGAPRAAGPR